MSVQAHQSVSKKPTNVTINSELLASARELKINLSATLEQALAQEVARLKRQRWLDDNKDAIAACNEFVEKNGLFADKYRVF